MKQVIDKATELGWTYAGPRADKPLELAFYRQSTKSNTGQWWICLSLGHVCAEHGLVAYDQAYLLECFDEAHEASQVML